MVSAGEKDNRSLGKKVLVEGGLGESFFDFWIANNIEKVALEIAGGGGSGSSFEELIDLGVSEGFGGIEFSDGAAFFDGFKNIHTPEYYHF